MTPVEDGLNSPVRGLLQVAVGWVLLAVFVCIVAFLGNPEADVRLFQLGYIVGFVGFGLLVWHVVRHPSRWWWVWFVGCVVIRIAVVHVAPSDDLYRYLWEGRIQAAGHNPYAVSPDDPVLESLRDDNWAHINHPDYPAIYPPLSQLVFRATVSLWPTICGMKTVVVVFDLAAVGLLALWLRRSGKSAHLAFVYALCPLTITAFAIDGHVDSLMLACVAGAGLADRAGRSWLCAGLVGAAILAKLIPVVLVPWLIWRHGRASVMCAVVVVLGYLPFVGAGSALVHSLVRFGGQTEMLGFGHTLVSYVVGGGVARWIGVVVIGFTAMRSAALSKTLDGCMCATMAALILFMPVVHYWYLTWLLIVLPFGLGVHWLVLCAGMVFYFEAAYQRATTGVWRMPAWVFVAVYLPFAASWAVDAWGGRRSRLLRRGDGHVVGNASDA
jgi:Glycosyltransferase family 87